MLFRSDDPDVFLTDIFALAKDKIEQLSGRKYFENQEAFRVILDHLRAATFLIGDEVLPSNKDQGYFVRRLIRRAVRFAHRLGIEKNFCGDIAATYISQYQEEYANLKEGRDLIVGELAKEEEKFRATLGKGLREYQNAKVKLQNDNAKLKIIPGEISFNLYQTYGFPIEIIEELAKEDGLTVDRQSFCDEMKKHQDLSRTASEGKFKGGLADHSEKTTQLHTVAHLMLAGLRKVLGEKVHQKGSNITEERIRFDFSHPAKMTEQEKKAVEEFVNSAIQSKTAVQETQMSLEEARKQGAEGCFENKYGEKVKVYTIEGFSKEICGGPHVKNTGEIQGTFRIKKEESSSAGVRRIKAVVE